MWVRNRLNWKSLERLSSASVPVPPSSSGGRGIAEDELVECQDEHAQQKGDGHRRDEGDVKIKLPRKGTLVRAQIPQKAYQKDHNLHGDDEPEIVDEKTFQLHPVEQGGQSAMFFFFIGAHLNSLDGLGENSDKVGTLIQHSARGRIAWPVKR
jgi:hypothetical protein